MGSLKLSPEEVTMIHLQVSTNGRASERFKRLSAIAWRDAAIVALLLQGLKAREITELRLEDLTFSKLIVDTRWEKRRTVELEDTTRLYLDKYLEGVIPEERVALFLSQRGKTINVRTIERMISKLGDQLGMKLVPSLLTNSANVK